MDDKSQIEALAEDWTDSNRTDSLQPYALDIDGEVHLVVKLDDLRAAIEKDKFGGWLRSPIAVAHVQTVSALETEVQQLKHLLGSHADGSQCTCTMIDPGDGYSRPPEWEQDPWCPTHPDMAVIASEMKERGEQIQDLRKVNTRLDQTSTTMRQEIQQLKEDKRNLQISVVELDRQLDEIRQEYEGLRELNVTTREQRNQAVLQLDALKIEHRLLQDQVRDD